MEAYLQVETHGRGGGGTQTKFVLPTRVHQALKLNGPQMAYCIMFHWHQ